MKQRLLINDILELCTQIESVTAISGYDYGYPKVAEKAKAIYDIALKLLSTTFESPNSKTA